MSEEIFRKKSLKRISSPEDLNDYVKVSNPGVWILLVGVIVLLLGFLAWGTFGRIDSNINTIGVVKNGILTTYVNEEDIDMVKETSFINIDGSEYDITHVDNTPMQLDYDFNDSYLHIANMSDDSWVYRLSSKVSLSNGIYKVSVITERIKPIDLFFD